MPERIIRLVIVGDSVSAVRALRATEEAATATEARLATMASAGRRITSLGRTMTTLAVPMLAVGGYAIKSSIDFKRAMELIHTQAGASQAEVVRMTKAVKAMSGRDVAQSPLELAHGLFHLESLGMRGSHAIRGLKAAAHGASIGMAGLEETTSALGAIVQRVGIKGTGDLNQVMGLLNATVGTGNMRMQDLIEAMGQGVLPAARNAGISLKDVMGALALFTDNTYKGSSAAAQFSTALHYLSSPNPRALKALGIMGISSRELANELHKPRGLLRAFRDLHDHLAKYGKTDQGLLTNALFPGGRGRIMLTLLNEVGQYEQSLNRLDRGQGRYADDQRKTMQQPAVRLQKMVSRLKSTFLDLGDALLPIALKVLPKMASAIQGVLKFFSGLPKPVKDVLAGLTGFLAIGGPILIFFGKLTTAVGILGRGLIGVGAKLLGLRGAGTILGGSRGGVGGGPGGLLGAQTKFLGTFENPMWVRIWGQLPGAGGGPVPLPGPGPDPVPNKPIPLWKMGGKLAGIASLAAGINVLIQSERHGMTGGLKASLGPVLGAEIAKLVGGKNALASDPSRGVIGKLIHSLIGDTRPDITPHQHHVALARFMSNPRIASAVHADDSERLLRTVTDATHAVMRARPTTRQEHMTADMIARAIHHELANFHLHFSHPMNIRLDSRVVAEAVLQYTLKRTAVSGGYSR